jgi:HAD superfamily phosphoserine phosphatase-like hydrolase
MTIVEKVIAHCRTWASRVSKVAGSEAIHIFGSTIHRDGRQFIPQRSDLDLIVVIPGRLVSAPARTDWLIKLQNLKRKLESSLIPLLGRDEASPPIVSVVAITNFELRCDIHKSKLRDFFRNNMFMDLLRHTKPAPLLRRAALPVDDRMREVLEFTQGVRNKFLSVSASGVELLVRWDDSVDALPKEIMRHAAIASDAGTDLQQGLENISIFIYSQKDFHSSYAALYDWLSVRRGARGSKGPLEPRNYLLLAEAVIDMSYARGRAKRGAGEALTHINGYKLFYFCLNNKLSLPALFRATILKPALLRKLEKITQRKGNLDPSLWFAACDRNVLNLLEDALDAHGRLEAGKPDDFLTQYMMFYDTNKSARLMSRRERNQLEPLRQTKAVVFDFDGTLTEPADYRTTWEKIWVALGYPKEKCFELHKRYQRKEFTHKEWCDITLEAFKKAKLRREQVVEIAEGISLVGGVPETITELRNHGLKLFILSGSIKLIIRHVLGDMYHEFDEIKANELLFDGSGRITKIEGTPYDFEGKAVFIKRIIQDHGLSPSDVLFVGNDGNDIFASQSGARTLCVNARLTDPANEEHWTYAIGEMVDLREILKFTYL